MSHPRPFLVIAALLGACTPDADADAGMETSPCLEGSCLGELECLSNLCVAPEGDTEGDADDGDNPSDDGDGGSDDGGGDNGGSGADGGDGTAGDDTTGDGTAGDDTAGEGGNQACSIPQDAPCGGESVAGALGLCDGSFEVSTVGSGDSIGLRTGLGPTNTWSPVEGSSFVVIGSGMVVDLDLETPDGDSNQSPTHCSDDIIDGLDPGTALPEPLSTTPTVGDCGDIPSLIGTGDCSNTLSDSIGSSSVHDYAAVRIDATVPPGVRSVSYDYAFFTAEYPAYVESTYADMHVAWLESEAWTGNIAFNGSGSITSQSNLLDYRDDSASVPEFDGTCMRGHGGTGWIHATAPVSAGEDITLVLAVFDMSDGIVDSFAFLDDVSWSCDEVERPRNRRLEG